MSKYRIHVFEEVRRSCVVEAESAEAAYAMADDPTKLDLGEGERTGEYGVNVAVDPLLEDGSVDYDKATWFPKEEAGRDNLVSLRFMHFPESRETTDIGPFEFVQITYEAVRVQVVGGDLKEDFAVFKDGLWHYDNQTFTDFTIFAYTRQGN